MRRPFHQIDQILMRMYPKFCIYMLDMSFHRVAGNDELFLDIGPVTASSKHHEHLKLTRAEAILGCDGRTTLFELLFRALNHGLLNLGDAVDGCGKAEVLQPRRE